MAPLTYGSVCSGIEAASVAWEQYGWHPAWFAEIEDFPSAVLAHHWPHVINHGDMTKIKQLIAMGLTSAPDVLVGGTPCQAFSIAGLRESLEDSRGQLTLEYVKLLNKIDEVRYEQGKAPAVGVWENVPGVLNTKDNAFGCLLGALSGEDDPLLPPGGRWTDCGFVLGPQRAVAWRVLDAQYFGLAQRRRRVFVVASAGDIDPREILFDSEGVRRDTRPSRKPQKGHAVASEDGFDYGDLEALVCMASGQADAPVVQEICPTLTCIHEAPLVAGTLDTRSGEACEQTMSQGNYVVDIAVTKDVAGTLCARTCRAVGVDGLVNGHMVPEVSVAFTQNSRDEVRAIGGDGQIAGALTAEPGAKQQNYIASVAIHDKATRAKAGNGMGIAEPGEPMYTLTAGDRHMIYTAEVSPPVSTGAPFSKPGNERVELDAMVVLDWRVRRLLPLECCRLQGFPDHHANIPYGRPKFEDQICPDSHQYKAYGNSMAVAVMAWIGKRIDDYLKEIGYEEK